MIAVALAPARRVLVWRPEAWLYVLSGFAALALVLSAPDGAGHVHHQHPGGARDMGGMAAASGWLAEWQHWGVMVLAMMLPVVAPSARRVAMRSLWRRRHRAMAAFVLGYLAVWFAAGAALVALPAGPAALAAVLLAAAAWQVAPPRRRALRRCAVLPPCATDGACAEAGARIGGRCVFTCAPMMAAMAVSHGLLLMSALFCLLLSERARGPNPGRRAGRPLEAWCLAGFAVVAGIAAL